MEGAREISGLKSHLQSSEINIFADSRFMLVENDEMIAYSLSLICDGGKYTDSALPLIFVERRKIPLV